MRETGRALATYLVDNQNQVFPQINSRKSDWVRCVWEREGVIGHSLEYDWNYYWFVMIEII